MQFDKTVGKVYAQTRVYLSSNGVCRHWFCCIINYRQMFTDVL